MKSGIKLLVLISAISAVNYSNGMAPRLQAEIVKLTGLLEILPRLDLLRGDLQKVDARKAQIETELNDVRYRRNTALAQKRAGFTGSTIDDLNAATSAMNALWDEQDALGQRMISIELSIKDLLFARPAMVPVIKNLEMLDAELARCHRLETGSESHDAR